MERAGLKRHGKEVYKKINITHSKERLDEIYNRSVNTIRNLIQKKKYE